MPRFALVSLAGALVSAAAGQASAQVQLPRFVPDVVGQFEALSVRPDAMGFELNGPDPSQCRHMQALVRTEAADGTPYLLVSRSGVDTGILCTSGDTRANLYIVRMGSRDRTGERMRSNRLRPHRWTTFTPPEPEDRVVGTILFDGSSEWPSYQHAGGMQQVGNIIALALEAPLNGQPATKIQFLDVSNPESPKMLENSFDPPTDKAGVVGLTPCGTGREGMPCATGHYLMLVTGGDNDELLFYESNGGDLTSAGLSWTPLEPWQKTELVGGEWPAKHQTLHFIREGDLGGRLFLAGARPAGFTIEGMYADDYIDLYEVGFDGARVVLTHRSTHHQISHPAGEGKDAGDRLASFAAASAFHVTPGGELLFYATEHDNDGPDGNNGRASVKMGEWRHIDMARPNSPTLAPAVVPGGPYVVDEGSTVLLSGSAAPAATKAWIELFEDHDYDGRYVVVDYDDRFKDDFNDFERLDPGDLGDFNGASNEASSLRAFAPPGCSIRANDNSFDDPAEPPGSGTLTLPGGHLEVRANLQGVSNDEGSADVDGEFSSVQFLAGCDAYYGAPLELRWDLDFDGRAETPGATAEYRAVEGPAAVNVLVRATHPMDGRTGIGFAAVRVRNVAPSVDSVKALDAEQRTIGIDIPFVLQGRPVTVSAAFSDPGTLDHQTASIDWRDGLVERTFDRFEDAFGGRTGHIGHTHAYTQPGTYDIAIEITDDDLDSRTTTTSVTVVSPVQAAAAVIGMVDAAIATSDGRVRKALQQARKALAGDVTGFGNSGALHKLQQGQIHAALAHLTNALSDLLQALALGADVTTAIRVVDELILALQ